MKVNNPNWRNGNVIGAFYNGYLWNNNISQIQLAVYEKDKIVEDETLAMIRLCNPKIELNSVFAFFRHFYGQNRFRYLGFAVPGNQF